MDTISHFTFCRRRWNSKNFEITYRHTKSPKPTKHVVCTNCLHLNLDKCAVLTITKKEENKCICMYTFVTDDISGVIIDEKLKLTKHFETITAKATVALGFVKRFFQDFSDTQTPQS